MKKSRVFSLLMAILLVVPMVTMVGMCTNKEPLDKIYYDVDEDLSGFSITVMEDGTTVYTKSEEQFQQEFQQYMEEVFSRLPQVYGNIGESYTETDKITRVTVKGYPGNQLSGGYSFSDGGTIYYSDDGGPTSSVSVSVSIPVSKVISVAVALGVSYGSNPSSSAIWSCYIPGSRNPPQYYKVFETKTVQIQPWVAYYRETSLEPFKVAATGQYISTVSMRSEAINVNDMM